MRRRFQTIAVIVALLLTACGGGESATSSTALLSSTSSTDIGVTSSVPTTVTSVAAVTSLPEEPTVPTSEVKPSPADRERGAIFVSGAELVLMESFPVQIVLNVSAELPTPCHEPEWKISDDGETLSVDLFTTVDPDLACIQVIEEAELQIPLGDWSGESRRVELNGEFVGDFTT